MPGDKSRDLQKVNRRSFVKTLSAIGVSGTTLEYLSQDALAQVTHDPTEEVPYVAFLRGNSPNRKPVYKTIERDEWERRYTAVDAAKRVSKKIRDLGVSSSAIATFTSVEQSPTDFGVKVKYYTEATSDGGKRTSKSNVTELRQELNQG